MFSRYRLSLLEKRKSLLIRLLSLKIRFREWKLLKSKGEEEERPLGGRGVSPKAIRRGLGRVGVSWMLLVRRAREPARLSS